jgi:hypothetical protein
MEYGQSLWAMCIFSPSGSKVVLTGGDGTAGMWNLETCRPIGQTMRHRANVMNASFNADESKVVTVTSEEARVWDTETGRLLGEPMPMDYGMNPKPVNHWQMTWAALNEDGTKVVTASGGTTARLWQLRTEEESNRIPLIDHPVLLWARQISGLEFDEDGEILVIADSRRVPGITSASLPAGPWADLGRWINTPPPNRTLDPKSNVTAREIAARERDFLGEESVEHLESALRYDPTLRIARLYLALGWEESDRRFAALLEELRTQQPPRSSSEWLERHLPDARRPDFGGFKRAAFLRRFELDALATNDGGLTDAELSALWVRATNHLLELPPDAPVGLGSNATKARAEALKAAQRAVELDSASPAAKQVLVKAQAAAAAAD